MITMAVIGSVIVAAFAWAGLHDYRQRRRHGRQSVSENFRRQREIDDQNLRDIAPGGEPGGM